MMTDPIHMAPHDTAPAPDTDGSSDLLEVATELARHWKRLLIVPIVVGAAAIGASFLVKPTFTAHATLLPPQQQGIASSSALAALGTLSALGGGGGGLKNPVDQYVAFLQSNVVADRIIEAFDLQKIYETDLHSLTRSGLSERSRMTAGKKDGVIMIEVDDADPQRAALIANRYVEELRHLTGEIAITEAQQRRAFFEKQLLTTRQHLTTAQVALQGTVFDSSALNVEPKAAADAYAKLKAEATALEVKIQVMRTYLSSEATELRQALSALAGMRAQLSKLDDGHPKDEGSRSADYISKYREYKYQETLFESFSHQFELAKLDESREGPLLQVIDKADVPDHKSKPKRALVGALGFLLTLAALITHILGAFALDRAKLRDPHLAKRLLAFKSALRGR